MQCMMGMASNVARGSQGHEYHRVIFTCRGSHQRQFNHRIKPDVRWTWHPTDVCPVEDT